MFHIKKKRKKEKEDNKIFYRSARINFTQEYNS